MISGGNYVRNKWMIPAHSKRNAPPRAEIESRSIHYYSINKTRGSLLGQPLLTMELIFPIWLDDLY